MARTLRTPTRAEESTNKRMAAGYFPALSPWYCCNTSRFRAVASADESLELRSGFKLGRGVVVDDDDDVVMVGVVMVDVVIVVDDVVSAVRTGVSKRLWLTRGFQLDPTA